MRGYTHNQDTADKLSLNLADVKALVARGELSANGEYISNASIERYLAGRRRNFGELAHAVLRAAMVGDKAPIDRIYAATATAVSSEASGGDGGFAVPATYSDVIRKRAFSGADLLGRCDSVTTPTNNITIPVDRVPPHDASTGIKVHYVGEQQERPQSKPALGAQGAKLKMLAAIVPVSEELLADAVGLGAYLERAVGDAFAWKGSFDIAWGTGAGQLLGFMNSGALITIAAEGAQTTDTINAANISKMYSRMPASSLPTAVWLVHPDAVAQLIGLQINGQIVYTPGDTDAPAGRLLGLPILPHELCNALGDLGDVMLVDPQSYMCVTKDPALRSLSSMHFYFDRDIEAFKFQMRIDGAPTWSSPIESRVGGTTRSPFITLAAR